MRDKNSTSKKYFEKFIDSNNNRIQASYKRLAEDNFNNENLPFIKNTIFFRSFEILVARYSIGEPIEILNKEFSKTINYIDDNGWHDSVVKFKMGRPEKIYNFYSVNQYCYILWMLSFAILIKAPISEINILKNLIENGDIDDRLLLYLLSKLTKKTYSKTTTQKYEPFKRIYLKKAVKDINSNHVKKYLDNWYKNTKYLTWHNYKKSIENKKFLYFGYWSFESAAITAILNLDDTTYRNNEYYPKDLVDYYRKNKN